MIRKLTGLLSRSTASRSAARPRPAAFRLEPLEERKMLDAAYINEIYLDPPGGFDSSAEYIELRGTPGMSLNNQFLIIVENEDSAAHNGSTGQIEQVFDLNGQQMGSDGFLTIRQAGSPYSVAPGTTSLTRSFELENSGFTAMLIKTNGTNAPTLGFDLDAGNNGLDVPTGRTGWTIEDSIGIFSEEDEAEFGRVYGQINFGPEPSNNYPAGATYVTLPYEVEYAGRWGNSTGQTADDWHISNLTDDVRSGYAGQGDFRQSAEPHVTGPVESNKGVAYGTNLTGTLGAPNIGSPTDIFINEIYLDPPGGFDSSAEYIELRGTPNMSLDGLFLIFVENEDNSLGDGGAGEVELSFDLTGYNLSDDGFLIFNQAGSPFSVAPGTPIIQYADEIENSGFTAMLIRNNGEASSDPYVDDINPLDLDIGNNGFLDVASGHVDWDVLDSIGLLSESDELEFGKLYGFVNYGPGEAGEPIPDYHDLGYEIEYVGRYGDSTGFTDADWHVSNLTDNPLSGYTGQGDFRQSSEPHVTGPVESNKNVPYGTNLTNTLGASNYPSITVEPPSVVGRRIFYNQSKFDGGSAAVEAADDAAIATDKTAYRAGDGLAQPANATSYSRGINGVMIDVEDLTASISASDFTLRVGNTNSPNSWAAAPSPSTVLVRPGAGVNGSDRIELVWADGVIKNTWLQVTFEGNDAAGGLNTNTGLEESDVFYFGNRIGDEFASSPGTAFVTNANDEISARLNTSFNRPITNSLDFDRSGLVNANDQIIARLNSGFITRINIPASGPLGADPAPLVADVPSDDGKSAVASALAATAGPKAGEVASWASNSVASTDAEAKAVSSRLALPAEAAAPKATIQANAADRVAEALDDSLLDSLLDELVLS